MIVCHLYSACSFDLLAKSVTWWSLRIEYFESSFTSWAYQQIFDICSWYVPYKCYFLCSEAKKWIAINIQCSYIGRYFCIHGGKLCTSCNPLYCFRQKHSTKYSNPTIYVLKLRKSRTRQLWWLVFYRHMFQLLNFLIIGWNRATMF